MSPFLSSLIFGFLLLIPANHGATIEGEEASGVPGETIVVQGNKSPVPGLITPLVTNFHTVSVSGQIVENTIYAGETKQDRIQYRRLRGGDGSTQVCQVRIDFLEFKLGQPIPETGNCKSNDVLSIATSQSLQDFYVCGDNRGQHLYLHYGDSDVITVNIIMQEAGSRFRLNTTFFSCYDPTGPEYVTSSGPEAAPYGCTQYYNDLSAKVRSFNYLQVLPLPYMQRQINNQNYMICVKDYPGTNEIRWTTCGPEDHFFISSEYSATGARSGPQNCTGDYIDISGSQKGRYCGSQFYPTSSTAKPFNLWVNFNDNEGPYIQNPMQPPPGIICYPIGDRFKCYPDPYDKRPYPEFDYDNGGFCLQYVIN